MKRGGYDFIGVLVGGPTSAASMMRFMVLSLFLAVEGFGQGGGNPEGLPLILTLLPFVTTH